MKLGTTFLTIVLSVGLSLAAVSFLKTTPGGESAPAKETAFERVMRTNTLRCGYVVLPPELAKEPNTGKLSGVSYDVVEEASKRLNLKVDWAEETSFTTMREGLANGRFDALCFSLYRQIPSARAMEYSVPLFYSTTSAYVRKDDHRFDGDLKAANDPSVTFAMIDGESSQFIHELDFPKARAVSLPQNTELVMMLESVKSGKADVAVASALVVMPYLLANADFVRRIEGRKPVRVYAHALAFAKGEHDLVSMFNIALDEMHNDGTIGKILDKYEIIPGSFVRVKSTLE